MVRRKQIVDDELVHLHDQFYIQATSSRADDRTRVLKHGETFAVFDRFGDVQPVGLGEQGIYHRGTRFLSGLELRVGGRRPLLLSSTVKQENDLLTVDLANPDLKNEAGQIVLPRGTLHVFRSKFLWRGSCFERLRLSNFGLEPIETELTLDFVADYADIFEVRGSKRAQTGRRLEPVLEKKAATLAYEGLDHVTRRTRIGFEPRPDELTGRQALFNLTLKSHETLTLFVTLACEIGDDLMLDPPSNDKAFEGLQEELGGGHLTPCRVRASETDLDEWISRSASDLQMMISQTRHGAYPFAGVPWYSTPFGRDGIITALELLWVAPEVARGVLSFLAATQATELQPSRDAEPGKILHEAREGEMATLREVPFGRYYGSVDATPLFVMLAAAYWRRTGDLDLPAHPGAARRARAALDRGLRRPRRRRLRRVRAANADRSDSARVEGLARLGLPRRRHAGRCADRAVRGAGLRLRRLPRRRRDRDGARRAREGRGGQAQGDGAAGPASRRSSGTRSSAPTCSRSTATSAPAGSAARTPATPSTPASR